MGLRWAFLLAHSNRPFWFIWCLDGLKMGLSSCPFKSNVMVVNENWFELLSVTFYTNADFFLNNYSTFDARRYNFHKVRILFGQFSTEE